MTSLRFSKIGMITQYEDGSFGIDPIPGLGGLFDTAIEYLEAWADTARFPLSESTIRRTLPSDSDLADEIVISIRDFPARLKEEIRKLTLADGPFPLHHPDFRHSNVIVDEEYRVLSVIDWENASTLPWELVDFSSFLHTVPRAIDAPWNYDAQGNPVDKKTRQRWAEREGYIKSVAEAEAEGNRDKKLSATLASSEIQNLASAVRLNHDPGKVGFYCRIFDQI